MDVVSEFKPTIADAVKINDAPAYADSTSRIPPQTYSIFPKPIVTTFELAPIKPAQMLGEPLDRLYNSWVKIGAGLYNTFDGEGYYNSLRSKEYSYGVYVKSLSSESTLPNSGYSGYSDNAVDLYGKKFYAKSTLFADLDYTSNVVHYYGYDVASHEMVSKDSTRQRFSYISPSLRWVSHYTDTTHINYDAVLRYFNLTDLHQVNENNVFADIRMRGYYQKQLVGLEASVNYYDTHSSTDTVNHTILRATPSIDFKGEKWKLNLALPLVCDFSKEINADYYPSVNFNYNVLDNIIIPYGGIAGGYDTYDYKAMTDVNPFLSPTALLLNSSRHEGYLGLRGSLDANTSYNVKATYAFIDNMPFFVTDMTGLANKFDIVYDNVKFFNLHGELAFQKTAKLKLLAKADYNHYQMTNELRPWYKPEVEITLSAHYNLMDKIVLKGDLFFIGKQLAKTFDSNGDVVIKQLNGIADINVGAEYKYSKLFNFFLNFDNIANYRYARWNNYPTQGFLLMGGISLTIL